MSRLMPLLVQNPTSRLTTRLRNGLAKLRRPGLQGYLVYLPWMTGLVASIEVLQRRKSLPELVAFYNSEPSVPKRSISVRRIVDLSRMLLDRIYGTDYCMKQSLILFYFLRRWNYPVELYFGVKKKDGKLDGHAWVELWGHPLVERYDPHAVYAVTYHYRPEARPGMHQPPPAQRPDAA